MFGHDSLPSKVYMYGSKPPHEGSDCANDQLSLAHRYQNRLIEIERERREMYAAKRRELYPIIDTLEKEIESLNAALAEASDSISSARADARSRKAGSERHDDVKQIRAKMKETYQALKAAKQPAKEDPVLLKSAKQIDADASAKIRAARKESGLYYGTYLDVEKRIPRSGSPPRFRRWDGNGKVGVQIQGGMTFAEALQGNDARLRISICQETELITKKGIRLALAGASAKSPWAIAQVRIKSTDDKKPIWCSVKFRLHRRPPDDARIKWAYLVRRRLGLTYHWSLQLTISAAGGFAAPNHAMRATMDTNGELLIPAERLEQARKPDDLKSIRDNNFNQARESLAAFRETLPVDHHLRLETETLPAWRSQGRLAMVVIRWRDQRFDGDAEIFAQLEAWRKQDKHLANWAGHNYQAFVRWRREFYRIFAIRLRQRFDIIHLHQTDLKKLQRKPKIESESPDVEAAKWQRKVAACGVLIDCIKSSGIQVVIEDGEKAITQTCSDCGNLQHFDAIRELLHTCTHCGRRWDQDVNAARNLRGKEVGERVAGLNIGWRKIGTGIRAAVWVGQQTSVDHASTAAA